MVKYKKCGALRIRIDGNKCIVVNLKLPSITSRSTSYLDFLRETIIDSNKQEFNNAVETICTRIKSLQYYLTYHNADDYQQKIINMIKCVY